MRIAYVGCPCGETHMSETLWPSEVWKGSVAVKVAAAPAVRVPRMWIVFHGLKAVELPALAARYGWPAG
jgi:hypothetical protein